MVVPHTGQKASPPSAGDGRGGASSAGLLPSWRNAEGTAKTKARPSISWAALSAQAGHRWV